MISVGGRTAAEIVNWIVKKTGPAATDLADVDAAKAFVDAEEFVVVGFFSSNDAAKVTWLFAHDEVNVHCSPAKKVFFSTIANFIISAF